MPALKFGPFGGVAPSVDPRTLPADGAQVAENLTLRFGDFRPIGGPGGAVASVAMGAQSVHRTPSGVWLSSASAASYVNGPINDPTVERVYLTGRSGYPEVWEGGAYRRLGVPAPTSAPTVTVTVKDEYTTAERSASMTDYYQKVRAAILANIAETAVGNAMPTVGFSGGTWYAHGTVPGLPTQNNYQVNYAVPMTGNTTTTAADAYLLNPVLAGIRMTISGAARWVLGTNWRARSYDVNQAALITALTALKQPDGTTQLVPTTEATAIAARIADIVNPAKDPMRSLVDAINASQNEILQLLSRTDNDPSRAYALNSAGVKLSARIAEVDDYIKDFDIPLGEILGDYTYLVPAAVEVVEDDRVYVYTHVISGSDQVEEESAPSPASALVTPDQNDEVVITRSAPVPGTPYAAATAWRIYRSTTVSAENFLFLAELPIGTTTYTDTKKQEELGPDVCPTIDYGEPPATLQGLTGMPNGVMAGFSGKTLSFSAAYKPYAWPPEAMHTLEFNIVALAVFGQTLVVLTTGNVYFVSGADELSMSVQKMENPQACVSARSVATSSSGVLYASPDGICMAGPQGVQVISLDSYSLTDWRALGPSASYGATADGVYYLALPSVSRIDAFDFVAKKLTTIPLGGSVTTLHVDLLTDTIYQVSGTSLQPLLEGAPATGRWKSGKVVVSGSTMPSWLRMVGPFTSAVAKLYADGDLYYTTPAITTQKPVRLPARRAELLEVEIVSTGRIEQVALASTAKELL